MTEERDREVDALPVADGEIRARLGLAGEVELLQQLLRGGGRVTGSEAGDEESYYQVEVTRQDGTQVDVQLNRDFQVVDSSADREDAGGR